MTFWAVIQTETQRERLAAEHLRKAEFETYLPRIKQRSNGVSRTPALFPNYLFVRIVDHWWGIRWSIGVVRVLMSGDQPSQLPEKVMDDIRKREGRDGLIKLPTRTLTKGASVRILSGQFVGHVALYDGMSGKDRQRVLLNLLGRKVPVVLAPTDRIETLDIAQATSVRY